MFLPMFGVRIDKRDISKLLYECVTYWKCSEIVSTLLRCSLSIFMFRQQLLVEKVALEKWKKKCVPCKTENAIACTAHPAHRNRKWQQTLTKWCFYEVTRTGKRTRKHKKNDDEINSIQNCETLSPDMNCYTSLLIPPYHFALAGRRSYFGKHDCCVLWVSVYALCSNNKPFFIIIFHWSGTALHANTLRAHKIFHNLLRLDFTCFFSSCCLHLSLSLNIVLKKR